MGNEKEEMRKDVQVSQEEERMCKGPVAEKERNQETEW